MIDTKVKVNGKAVGEHEAARVYGLKIIYEED